MNHISYYQSRCGGTYRIRTLGASSEQPSRVLQARRSRYALVFGPEYPTHPAEVERLLTTGFLVELSGESLPFGCTAAGGTFFN